MAKTHTVNIHEAKAKLSQLIAEAMHGTEIVIARAGTPVVKLVPLEATPQRAPGCLKGKVVIGKDFDAPMPI